MNIKKWLQSNAESLKGKTILITGSTGGLGGYSAKILTYLGADLILADRNKEKSDRLKNELIEINKDIKITQVKLDFTSIECVEKACQEVNNLPKVDGVIFSAGVYSVKIEENDDYNIIFKTNFLYPYYFMKGILKKVEQSDFAKIIVVGSISYNFARLNEKDLDYSHCKSANKIYGNSKRWLMVSFSELLKNNKKVHFAISHPGITPTNITRHFPKFVSAIIKYPMKMIFSSPKKASLTGIKALFDDVETYEWVGPRFCNIWGKPKKKKIKKIPEEERKEMFELAEKMYKNLKNQLNEGEAK